MLLRNDLKYLFSQPIIWLCSIFSPLFAFTLSSGLAIEEGNTLKQFSLHLLSIQMIQLTVLVGVIAPVTFLRDQIHNMDEIISTTPITSKYRSLLRVGSLLICLLIISMMSSLVIWLYQCQVHGFDWQAVNHLFFNSFFLLIPNCYLLIVIAFWICDRFQSALVSYTTFGMIWVGYLFFASITGNPILAGSGIVSESLYQMSLWFDPFAYTAFIAGFAEPHHWELIINRLVIIVLTTVIYIWAMRTTKKNINKPVQIREPVLNSIVHYRSVVPRGNDWFMLGTLYQLSLAYILKQPITSLILFLWSVVVFNSVASSFEYAEAMSIVSPTSIDAINHYAFDMHILFGCLLLALWSWQVSCYAKRFNMAELIAALPVKTVTLLYSQLLVVATLAIIFSVMSFIGTSLAEWFSGSEYQPSQHIYILALMLLPLILVAWVAVCIFNICSSLVAGLFVIVILLLKFTPVMTFFGLTHTFWSLAWTPLQAPNEFWGYRASLNNYWPYMRVWLIAVFSFVAVSQIFNHRGVGVGRRQIKVKDTWVLVPIFLSLSLFVQLHINLVSEKPLTNSHKRESFKANYEKTFVDWKHKKQPIISHIDANVDFYPHKQFAHFELTYTLTNPHSVDIKHVLVGRAGFYKWANIKIAGARRVRFYPTLNQAVYEFERAIKPNEIRQLSSRFEVRQAKLWPAVGHHILTPEFNYIRSVPMLPTIGYQANYELIDINLRKQYGLLDRNVSLPSKQFASEKNRPDRYDHITMSSTVSTAVGYHVVTQGKQIALQRENDREIFKFEAASAFNNLPAWLSIPYSPVIEQFGDVKLQVFAKQKTLLQSPNSIVIHLQAMKDTLTWFKDNVVAYKAKQLSLVAAPKFGGTGFALPQIILIENKVGFRASPSIDAGFDQRYRRAVHETAHQWFGHDIGNSVNEDSAFLVESMAKYIELVMIEKRFGKAAMNSLIEYETRRYEQALRVDISAKQSLVDSTKSYDQYSKATIIFAKLRDRVGDEIIIKALKSVWENYAFPNRPATSMDLIRALQLQVNTQDKALINQFFLEP
ncbi:hypothetical protein LPA49_06485 [Pseudoalteromonas sp. MB41]|uniref:M1 family aminopeptidase n=1 Tax=Pseudoalteromonas sp. MB41 TaxID=2896366 RepID=UPI001E5DA936|nr:M1 family aminopeptidase [Pseudoalteromonas sp. MB41]MCC9660207.1 hypothetical protein [Pseudoalteromonas sp. MB41]